MVVVVVARIHFFFKENTNPLFSWPSEHQRLVLLCSCLSLAQSVNHALSLQITFWTAGVGTEPLLHSVNYYVLRLPHGSVEKEDIGLTRK